MITVKRMTPYTTMRQSPRKRRASGRMFMITAPITGPMVVPMPPMIAVHKNILESLLVKLSGLTEWIIMAYSTPATAE